MCKKYFDHPISSNLCHTSTDFNLLLFAHHPQSSCSVVTCEIVRKDLVGAIRACTCAAASLPFKDFILCVLEGLISKLLFQGLRYRRVCTQIQSVLQTKMFALALWRHLLTISFQRFLLCLFLNCEVFHISLG